MALEPIPQINLNDGFGDQHWQAWLTQAATGKLRKYNLPLMYFNPTADTLRALIRIFYFVGVKAINSHAGLLKSYHRLRQFDDAHRLNDAKQRYITSAAFIFAVSFLHYDGSSLYKLYCNFSSSMFSHRLGGHVVRMENAAQLPSDSTWFILLALYICRNPLAFKPYGFVLARDTIDGVFTLSGIDLKDVNREAWLDLTMPADIYSDEMSPEALVEEFNKRLVISVQPSASSVSNSSSPSSSATTGLISGNPVHRHSLHCCISSLSSCCQWASTRLWGRK